LDVFSRQLVSVQSPSELCFLQRSLLRLRPDLFDFADLPPLSARRRFQRYAQWRARQDVRSEFVQDLDRCYDSKPWAIRRLAVTETSRFALNTPPRRAKKGKRERFRGEMGRARPSGRARV